MTLQELKALVGEAKSQDISGARILKNEMRGIVLSREFEGDSELRVYEQSYVFYRIDDYMTVFLLQDLPEEYFYDSAMELRYEVSGCCEDCIYRILLESENRIFKNMDDMAHRRQISYNAISED